MKRPRPRKSAPGGSKIEARGGQHGLLEGFRVERPSFKAKAVFEAILEAILTLRPPPWGFQNQQKSLKMGSKIEALFETRFEAILKPPGRLLASMLGSFWA